MEQFSVYKDIKARTGGEIYLGVVGPVRTGKSTFINSFAGKSCTRTGNKPGVTKGKQWIRLNKNLELLDTPGILWPKFEDQKVGERLAMIGTINDEILQTQELAASVVSFLRKAYAGVLAQRYGVEEDQELWRVLEEICINRRCLQKGQAPDLLRGSQIVLDDFRSGRLGRITLEYPEEWQ